MTTGVRRYASWHEVVDEPVRRWETPTGGVSVILSFGPAMRVSSASASGPTTVTSFVVGMYDEPALTEHDGVGHGVQVDLTAAGPTWRRPRGMPIRRISTVTSAPSPP
jgi:hypothetical protein